MERAHSPCLLIGGIKMLKSSRLKTLSNLWFVIPVIIIIASLLVFPLFFGGYLSFFKSVFRGVPKTFQGFTNYVKVLTDIDFYKSFLRTGIYTASAIIIKIILGILFALALNKKFRGIGIFRGIALIPWSIPPFVVALIWYGILDWSGPINEILHSLNIQTVDWFSYDTALITIIMINIWKGWPFFFMSVLSGLQAIPDQLYEAAEIDGAGVWKSFWKITLPSLKPVILTTTLLSTIWTFGEFETVYLTTAGGPGDATRTLPILIYETAFSKFKLPLGITQSILILPIFLVAIFWVVKLMAKTEGDL
ncbi:MAG: multiple sugar transport system permease protein [Kosmotogales bacterium]|nr:multiple sugar transport system permease protein [Kosmotogales bacterium]